MYVRSQSVLFNACTVLFLLGVQKSDGFWLWGSNSKVDGKWSEWSSYGTCQLPTTQEIYPYRQRTRQCNNPVPKNGGKFCEGKAMRKGPCLECDLPLGMESKIIKDSQITASTFHEEYPARKSRLNGPSAWCAKDLTKELFLQVDLKSLTMISAIATQGFYPDPSELSFRLGSVSKYQITYSDDGIAFEVYEDRQKNKVFKGNGKDLKIVRHSFDPQIAAKHIRIHPTAYIKFVCMKIELYGCRFKCGGYLPQAAGDLLAVSSEVEDVDCFWQAYLPLSRKINLDFINFNLPCKYGQVDIRGDSSSYGGAQRLGHFCDKKLAPPPIESSTNKLWIRFRSNSSDHLVGFYGIYFPNCDNHLNSTVGTFNSPNYPNPYNHNTKCTWSIVVPKGKRVRLSFLDFDIEEDSGCDNDHVIVSGSNSSIIGKYCNSNKPPRYVCSKEKQMLLVFKSDDALAMKGFKATYKAINTDAPCVEPSTSIITPTPTISTSFITANFSSTLAFIKPTATFMLSPTLIRNASIGVLGTGTGSQRPVMGSVPSKKEDDDEDTGLTTIIIISVFSFIVLCMIIASVIPSMIHGYEKRKREREWLAAADLALKRTSCVENEYEMQPLKAQEINKDSEEQPNEKTALFDTENPSVHEENGNLGSSIMQNSVIEKPDESKNRIEDSQEFHEPELEYDNTDLNLNTSYEDLGSSFASEMASLMNNYDYISPKKQPEKFSIPTVAEEYQKGSSGIEEHGEEDTQNEQSQIDPSENATSQSTTKGEGDIHTQDHEGAESEKDIMKQDPEIDDKNEKLQNALTDLKDTLLAINADSGSIPDIENPETCTNSTASVRGSQDIQNVPTVEVFPVWEKIDESNNPDRKINSDELESTISNRNNKETGSLISGYEYDHSNTSNCGTETCV